MINNMQFDERGNLIRPRRITSGTIPRRSGPSRRIGERNGIVQLFVFTAGNPEAYRHYRDTIEDGFTLESIKPFIDGNTYERLKEIYGNEKLYAWGATPGEGNERTWKKMDANDRVLAYRENTYEYHAIITLKIRNAELAKHLWGTNPSGETWEHMYFLKGRTRISISSEAYNRLIEYPNEYGHPQGFKCTSPEKTRFIEEHFGSVDGFLRHLEEMHPI